ncbi:alpha/beta fold hydrolase [Oerskovia sp. Sa1BUA8]|uniref:Alpha/beta fold hydrolase n=1 Tax=Oerskovia douganii TaxID=2762210 RepID=A0A9D5U5A0_9CELL|nr:alpha/beta hydrolase [Oerskovia douganii]MBE7698764.1 alpha/beta fold hydrolase [Oerskovia douganii]
MKKPSRRTTALSAATLALALLLGACAPSPKVQSPAETGSTGPTGTGEDVPAELAEFYGQSLVWEDCGGGFECTTATAPLSWQDPAQGKIELALKRLPASGEKIGSLLTNPGGPGGSGIDYVTSAAGSIGAPVREAYDVIGFDPRGVGSSTPVVCLDDAAKDVSLSRAYDDSDEGRAEMAADLKAWADACAQNTGDLLGNVDTQSAARDMDMLRAVLGDPQLNYLGFSYGTQLGATYAGLFPEKVGRMVLDGAIDTTLTSDEISAQQAVGFENALRAYVEDCQGGQGCPLTGSVDDGMAQVEEFLDQVAERPLRTTSDRRLTSTLAFYGIALPLYNNESWSALTAGLDSALSDGDGTTLLSFADLYNGRNPDGTFSDNSAEAFRAINCLDARGNPDPEVMAEQAAQIEEAAPTMGSFFTYGGMSCVDWAYPVVEQEFDLHAEGAAPIVVIGTTNDPATPYVWAEGLAKTLDSASLLTWEGEGHTAYGRSNACVGDAVDAYLVAGEVPQDGKVC